MCSSPSIENHLPRLTEEMENFMIQAFNSQENLQQGFTPHFIN